MKLVTTGKNIISLGYETPEPGESILEIDEGVKKYIREKDGSSSLIIPFVIDKVIKGPESNQGLKFSHFTKIENPRDERILAEFLFLIGLGNMLTEKFGDEVDVKDDRFINTLSLKMPGRFIKARHDKYVDKNNREWVNVIEFEGISPRLDKNIVNNNRKNQFTSPEHGTWD